MHSSSAFAFWDHNVFPWLYGLTTKQGGHLRIDLLCKAGIQSLLSCRDLSSAEISSWTEVLMKRETTESLRGSLGQAEERLVCRFRAGSLRAYRVLSHKYDLDFRAYCWPGNLFLKPEAHMLQNKFLWSVSHISAMLWGIKGGQVV